MSGPLGLCARRTLLSAPRRAQCIIPRHPRFPASADRARRYHLGTARNIDRRPLLAASRQWLRSQSSSSSAGKETTKYTFDELRSHLSPETEVGGPDVRPAPLRLIDVREPGELQATGRIPSAQNMPISSVPDGAFLPPDEFEDRFGFPKPSAGDEVVFYCKSGVRSRAAAQMVVESWSAEGVKVSEFPGSWTEWEGRGGEVER